jgi:hypothetical protein
VAAENSIARLHPGSDSDWTTVRLIDEPRASGLVRIRWLRQHTTPRRQAGGRPLLTPACRSR